MAIGILPYLTGMNLARGCGSNDSHLEHLKKHLDQRLPDLTTELPKQEMSSTLDELASDDHEEATGWHVELCG